MRPIDWWRALDELLFPLQPRCAFCGERPCSAAGVCRPCLDSLAVNWQKGEVHGWPYFSLLPYRGFARDLIHKMKFQSRLDIARAFGFLLGLAVREEPALAGTDVFMPVPLHITRLQQRGFNQAEVLADKAAKAWRRPVSTRLIRVRETFPQSGLSAAKRKSNLNRAFAFLPGENLQNKQCLIIDDIITSGFTFSAAAGLIRQYGGRPVGAFIARTEILGGGK